MIFFSEDLIIFISYFCECADGLQFFKLAFLCAIFIRNFNGFYELLTNSGMLYEKSPLLLVATLQYSSFIGCNVNAPNLLVTGGFQYRITDGFQYSFPELQWKKKNRKKLNFFFVLDSKKEKTYSFYVEDGNVIKIWTQRQFEYFSRRDPKHKKKIIIFLPPEKRWKEGKSIDYLTCTWSA